MAIQFQSITSKDISESRQQVDKVYEEYRRKRLSVDKIHEEENINSIQIIDDAKNPNN